MFILVLSYLIPIFFAVCIITISYIFYLIFKNKPIGRYVFPINLLMTFTLILVGLSVLITSKNDIEHRDRVRVNDYIENRAAESINKYSRAIQYLNTSWNQWEAVREISLDMPPPFMGPPGKPRYNRKQENIPDKDIIIKEKFADAIYDLANALEVCANDGIIQYLVAIKQNVGVLASVNKKIASENDNYVGDELNFDLLEYSKRLRRKASLIKQATVYHALAKALFSYSPYNRGWLDSHVDEFMIKIPFRNMDSHNYDIDQVMLFGYFIEAFNYDRKNPENKDTGVISNKGAAFRAYPNRRFCFFIVLKIMTANAKSIIAT